MNSLLHYEQIDAIEKKHDKQIKLLKQEIHDQKIKRAKELEEIQFAGELAGVDIRRTSSGKWFVEILPGLEEL